MIDVRVQTQDFDIAVETARLHAVDAGAIASFIGLVRGDDGVTSMTLEHYPGMTESMLRRIAEEATARWPLSGVTLIHRIGTLRPGDQIVLVLAASRHRAAALEAVAFLIDWLKTGAPFWKKERRGTTEGWVEARAADDAAAERWRTSR